MCIVPGFGLLSGTIRTCIDKSRGQSGSGVSVLSCANEEARALEKKLV